MSALNKNVLHILLSGYQAVYKYKYEVYVQLFNHIHQLTKTIALKQIYSPPPDCCKKKKMEPNYNIPQEANNAKFRVFLVLFLDSQFSSIVLAINLITSE